MSTAAAMGNSIVPSAELATDEMNVDVRGLRCAACVSKLHSVLLADPAVVDAQINLATEHARIHVTADVDVGVRLGQAAQAAGYQLVASETNNDAYSADERRLAQRDAWMLLFAAVCSAPLLVQMGVMMTGAHWHLPGWAELLAATPVQLVLGAPFYVGTWYACKRLSPNMDVLVALGSTAAYLYSLWLFLTLPAGTSGVFYFEASALILTLIFAGKVLERRARRQTAAALDALLALRPETARVRRTSADGDSYEVVVSLADLSLGELVIVKPGERMPADGVIVAGDSEVDESMLTGESVAVARSVGNRVAGATLNGDGLLEVRVAAVGKESALGRIAALVEQAQLGNAPVQRMVDRVSAWFVPAVLVLSACTLAGWMLYGAAFETALIAAVSVLVIACPCALGLATPTAIVAGTGAAARHGILIKNVTAMERSRAVDTVYFDKTGTLTEGTPSVRNVHPLGVSATELLGVAASAEQRSEHPLGRAFVDAATAQHIALSTPDTFRALTGQGLIAELDGTSVALGTQALMRSLGATLSAAEQLPVPAHGDTRIWVVRDAQLLGAVDLRDELRPFVAGALGLLKQRGAKTGLLSGDSPNVVEAVVAELPLDEAHGRLTPAAKAQHIKAAQHSGGCIAFVGDGINDAPALAQADVGIAMGGATDVAMETADITLLRSEPGLVPAALDVCDRTLGKIAQNLFWACAYNVVCIPAAAFGYLSPTLAGAAMAASSVSVVTNSLLLSFWKPPIFLGLEGWTSSKS